MAENPSTWGQAENAVWQVLRDQDKDVEVVGLSLVRQITDALRGQGLLNEHPNG